MTDPERCVFDVANDNVPIAFEIDVEISSEKVAARAELERLMAEQRPAITICKYRKPRGPQKWKKKERKADNDNEPESNPLIEALRRDGRQSDIPWIMRYRLLVDVVGTSAYDDKISMSDKGIHTEARSLRLGGKSFDKSFARMTDTDLPGGEISYREERHTMKQVVSIGQRTNRADPETGARTQTSLRLMKSEDERIARMDGKPILEALRAGLGDLVHIFEEVVIGNGTLTWVGERMGYKHKARSREAKILVYTAIDRLRDQWRLIDRQMKAQAAACDRRVEARRNELSAARAQYLGLAA